MTWQQRLDELRIQLPPVASPLGSYIAAKRVGKLIFTSGQLPMKEGRLVATGKVPADVSLEEARSAARQAVLNALAAAADAAGSLDSVAQIVRLHVFVNSSAGFTDQAQVANGASDLLAEIFGEAGKHTRCAIGAAGSLTIRAACFLQSKSCRIRNPVTLGFRWNPALQRELLTNPGTPHALEGPLNLDRPTQKATRRVMWCPPDSPRILQILAPVVRSVLEQPAHRLRKSQATRPIVICLAGAPVRQSRNPRESGE